jgi:tetratricopeptide (TPR) repeat protein
VIEDLLKMVKKEKYKDLNDQIYFTLAEIEMSQNNENKAIEYFSLSALNNNNDKKLKSEAYFKIGELNFKNQKYLEARNYYDSTLMVMEKDDLRYGTVKKYVDNLRDIATNIQSIQYYDTLLYFATLDTEAQKKQVTDYILQNRVKDTEPQTSGNLVSRNINAKIGMAKTSSFFAYDKKGVEKGMESFKKDWGQISLEDNWRRSMKASSNGIAYEENIAEKENEEEKPLVSQEEYDKFMREVPTNPIRKKEIEDKVMTSMFTLGKLFRDKVNHYENSALTLEKMHNRFGATPYELDSYYYLYLDYLDLENVSKSEDYKNRIIKKFPESQYAMILKDPAYLAKIQKEGSSAEKYYKKVYQMFEAGQYDKVIQAADQAPSVLVSDNSYDARLALLRAMSLGSTQGREAYIKGLNEVISGYPGTPEHLKAKEIIRFLGGDNSAFANVQDVDKIYTHDPGALHYVAITTYDWPENELINFKIAISEYNKQNFKVERLQLGDASLNIQENIQIILIRKFENEEKSIEYYKKVMKDLKEFSGGTERSFDVLPISQNNYRKMISQYSTNSYRAFLEQVVLPNQSK